MTDGQNDGETDTSTTAKMRETLHAVARKKTKCVEYGRHSVAYA